MKRGGHYLALCAGNQFYTLVGPYSEDAIAKDCCAEVCAADAAQQRIAEMKK